jgi:hypothetical protein
LFPVRRDVLTRRSIFPESRARTGRAKTADFAEEKLFSEKFQNEFMENMMNSARVFALTNRVKYEGSSSRR